jgi:Zn-dependent peptidase ImmA (M78 family)
MFTSSSTTSRGIALENQIYEYFFNEIQAGRFWAKSECCRLKKKPRYHSRDRGGDITFDVSIEISLPGANEFSTVVLIECKNYTHSVPVDDAEEFFAKVQQVAAANAKAVLASTASFQQGTREYARSKRIGLLRYFDKKNCKWELYRSPSSCIRTTLSANASDVGHGLSVPDYHSKVFDLYLQSPIRDTNSISEFFGDMLLEDALSPVEIRKVVNARANQSDMQGDRVPFLEVNALENVADNIFHEISYHTGKVSLPRLCEYERIRSGLVVNLNVEASPYFVEMQVLGRINFDPLCIEIFRQTDSSSGRLRFTLAHELAHHLLGHGKYMLGEYCQDDDFSSKRGRALEGTDIARMEFQANFLAASILLPKHKVIEDFNALVQKLQLPNRGYGALYLDAQPCNIENYELVSAHFMREYGVSRAATTIRLQSLGFLQDGRKPEFSGNARKKPSSFEWP